MNNITTHPEHDKLIDNIQELENHLAILVKSRDKLLFHIGPKLHTEYMLKVGKLEYAIFDYHCKILRLKRKIEMIQSCLNRDISYNIDEIEDQLEKEFYEYNIKLKEKQNEIEKARLRNSSFGRTLTDEESSELRRLYTEIVKRLHPDLNPDLTVEQHGQYIDAVNAYKNADLTELRIIYLLLEKTTRTRSYLGTSLDKLTDRHKSLLIEKDHLISEIDLIKKRFPFIYINLITKKGKLNKLINELSEQLSCYCDQYNSLEIKLQEVINDE